MTTETYFSRGWYWDNTVVFIQFYNNKPAAKFIVKLKDKKDKFENYVK